MGGWVALGCPDAAKLLGYLLLWANMAFSKQDVGFAGGRGIQMVHANKCFALPGKVAASSG